MVNGVSAYQQQLSVLQSTASSSAKAPDDRTAASRVREDDADRKDSVSISARAASQSDRTSQTTASRDVERSDDQSRRQSVSTTLASETGAAGKDASQRRGSLLDITV